jgi:large subunit ribosomal protein L10
VLAEYHGLTVAEMTELRAKARASGVSLRVVRNTLLKRAVAGTGFECIKDELKGPLLTAFARHEPSSAARLIRDFAKDHDKLVPRIVALNGRLLTAKDLDAVAKLPTKEEAISMLMSVMLAPVTKFVRTLAEPHAKLVRTVAAIRDQKQAS